MAWLPRHMVGALSILSARLGLPAPALLGVSLHYTSPVDQTGVVDYRRRAFLRVREW
jgi:hypothetical protein